MPGNKITLAENRRIIKGMKVLVTNLEQEVEAALAHQAQPTPSSVSHEETDMANSKREIQEVKDRINHAQSEGSDEGTLITYQQELVRLQEILIAKQDADLEEIHGSN